VIQVLFVVIAAVGLAAALGTILARNLVRAALYLIGFFFAVACIFVLLEAEFLAALQVLVYIGAVAILLMFGIMLTRNIQGDDPTATPVAWKLPGLLAGLLIFAVLAYGISSQRPLGNQKSWATLEVRPPIEKYDERGPADRSKAVGNMAAVVGEELTKRYVIAFEVAGLLLTAALVGAIAIAHREETEPGVGRSSRGSAVAGAGGSPSGNGQETPAQAAAHVAAGAGE
jgi:NADH:ubiquinone oxidoreductase subunit 6 (subunit J)